METDFLLYGAGGHAKVILNCLNDIGHNTIGLFDDDIAVIQFYRLPIYHQYRSDIFPDSKIIVSVGNNSIRRGLILKITHKFGSVVHPSAQVSKMSSFEIGTVILQNVVIQPSVRIGKHCIINSGSVIEHDCELSDFVHVSPHSTLCGGVKVGEGTHIGAASVIIPGITIGCWTTIGAGAVVINDIPDYAVAVGNPAIIKKFSYL